MSRNYKTGSRKKPMIPPKSPKPRKRDSLKTSSILRIHPPIRDSTATLSTCSNAESIHSNRSSSLSVCDDPFPCAISPSTLESMELVFSFNDSHIVDKLADSWPVKCTYIVKEVIVTERTYLQSLADVIKGYLTPLYSHVLETGESSNFISTVFGNIVKLHQIHTTLLEAMQSSSASPEDFARVFLDCDFLTQYTLYCTNFSRSSDCLEQRMSEESDVRDFIKECQKKLSHSLPLSSELIKPVQRILKYPLLLGDLNKQFDWSDHPGYNLLKEALVKMSSVAQQINTAFNNPVKTNKGTPKTIALKRSSQFRDLQKSRSMDTRRSCPISPAHASLTQSRSLNDSPYRSMLFPVPASATRSSMNDLTRNEVRVSSSCRNSYHDSFEKNVGTKARVKDLKGFFEKLTTKSEDEMQMMSSERRQTMSSELKRAASLSEDSFVQITHGDLERSTSVGNMKIYIERPTASVHLEDSNAFELVNRPGLRRFGRSKKKQNNVMGF